MGDILFNHIFDYCRCSDCYTSSLGGLSTTRVLACLPRAPFSSLLLSSLCTPLPPFGRKSQWFCLFLCFPHIPQLNFYRNNSNWFFIHQNRLKFSITFFLVYRVLFTFYFLLLWSYITLISL